MAEDHNFEPLIHEGELETMIPVVGWLTGPRCARAVRQPRVTRVFFAEPSGSFWGRELTDAVRQQVEAYWQIHAP